MSKNSSVFVCQSCGFNSAKWLGKCSSCGSWNSFVEEVKTKSSGLKSIADTNKKNPVLLSQIESKNSTRTSTGMTELDRVLGGGVVAGSAVLIGGEPGIGKSTLLLQAAMAYQGKNVLYVSGEESEEQIKLRANRLKEYSNNSGLYIYSESNLNSIIEQASKNPYDLMVIDSIQTLFNPEIESSPGSVSQVRECSYKLIEFCKGRNIPLFLIGHINKEGNIAGPKVLEHLVDTVLQFEGDRNHLYRLVRTLKNRFGNSFEIGVFEMKPDGLNEVQKPGTFFLSGFEQNNNLSGSVITTVLEGNRAFLLEVQALVSSAVYGMPQRVANGFDAKRLNLLLAVLEKKCGFKLGQKDVFMNITGGFRINDPAIDLAVAISVLSSNEDVAVDKSYCLIGEVGLGGEIRGVLGLEQRIKEAYKMGFTKIIIPAPQFKADFIADGLSIIPAKDITAVLGEIFG
ncbi:MAG: DNA repair protein RadA [Bacteroidota bacterium]|jgi:DNA repair protein RadA/Sms